MKSARTRWMLWLALMAGAAWLAFFGDSTPASGALSLPTRTAAIAASAPAPSPAGETVVALVSRAQLLGAAVARPDTPLDPFSTRRWNPPAPAPRPVSAAPVAPPAPPLLPYAYLGKKLESGQWEVFLSRGEHSFVVREGGALEGQYRVDRIAPPTLTLTFLPLGQARTH